MILEIAAIFLVILVVIILWAVRKSGQVTSIQRDVRYLADEKRDMDIELEEQQKKLEQEQDWLDKHGFKPGFNDEEDLR